MSQKLNVITMIKEPLFGKTLDQISTIVLSLGMPRFTAKQIAGWLYKQRIETIEQMTNISQANRDKLSEKYAIGLSEPINETISKDGTKKYLFATSQGKYIEAAYIPASERATLCVSSQVGCKMGCLFCMTGKQGFSHNLSANEILNQVRSIPESEVLTNIVYMGMGEPLDNLEEVLASLEVMTSEWGFAWSPSRITLSTIGVLPALRTFLDQTKVNLAVSLHNPFSNQREEIMPVEKVYPIKDIVALLREYDFTHQRRVSFEYIVLRGQNYSAGHVKELCRLLDGVKCRINLIGFHEIPGSEFASPELSKMETFRDALTAKGIITTIRTSRGEDIQAACGLLSTLEKNKEVSAQ